MQPTTILACASLLAVALSAPPPADAVVSGRWEGTARCTGALQGTRRSLTFTAELNVTEHVEKQVAATLTLLHESNDLRFEIRNDVCGILSEPHRTGMQLSIASVAPPHLAHSGVVFKRVRTFSPDGEGRSGRITGAGPLVQDAGTYFQCRNRLHRTSFANPLLDLNGRF